MGSVGVPQIVKANARQRLVVREQQIPLMGDCSRLQGTTTAGATTKASSISGVPKMRSSSACWARRLRSRSRPEWRAPQSAPSRSWAACSERLLRLFGALGDRELASVQLDIPPSQSCYFAAPKPQRTASMTVIVIRVPRVASIRSAVCAIS